MNINRFEDIKTLQEARKLVKSVYNVAKQNGNFKRDLRLAGQVQDAAGSSMANIAEGFARRDNKEFAQFLFISKSSATEVQSHMYVALDQEYVNQLDFNSMYRQTETVKKCF